MRLAEIVGALSLASDASAGLAPEKGLRTVLVAIRLAERAGASPEAVATVYWVSALRFVGCTGFAPEEAVFAAGDDTSVRRTLIFADFDRPVDFLRRVVLGFGPSAAMIDRATGVARFLLDRDVRIRYARAHCESAVFFARTFGMPEEVARALATTGERFDGCGVRGTAGEDLPFASRVADVADALELFAWTGGPELARDVLSARSGHTLDPHLVETALAVLPELVNGLQPGEVWDVYMAAEPPSPGAEDLDQGCAALGLFADVKSVYTLAHSRRVSALAEGAGRAAGLGDDACALLRRAASVHDLGRVAVPTGTWDKKGPLNAMEWQSVRAHSHHTETILRSAGMGDMADIAGATHERGLGAGYHKGVALDRVPLLARWLAAADVMAALGEVRPHRGALDDDAATKEMRSLVSRGELDARAAQAVLDARGVPRTRKSAWPAGLTDREVEVVRLVAVGRTNKDIGALLGMSPRTAQKHVMHVYDKVGLESRAGLALYALEHGLLDD